MLLLAYQPGPTQSKHCPWAPAEVSFCVPPALRPAADEAAQAQEDAPQREAYEQAELHIQVKQSTGSISCEQLAASILEQVQDALHRLLTKEPQLCGKKGTYMKFGCKGDWPNLEQVAEFAEQANKAKQSNSRGAA